MKMAYLSALIEIDRTDWNGEQAKQMWYRSGKNLEEKDEKHDAGYVGMSSD
jgi:hypothetical protein